MFDKKGHTVRYLSSPKDLDIIKVVLNINRDEILKDILTNKKSSQKNNDLVIATGCKSTTSYFVNEHSTI